MSGGGGSSGTGSGSTNGSGGSGGTRNGTVAPDYVIDLPGANTSQMIDPATLPGYVELSLSFATPDQSGTGSGIQSPAGGAPANGGGNATGSGGGTQSDGGSGSGTQSGSSGAGGGSSSGSSSGNQPAAGASTGGGNGTGGTSSGSQGVLNVDRLGGITSDITWGLRLKIIGSMFTDPLASEREIAERAGYQTVKEGSLSTTVSAQTSTRTSGPDILDSWASRTDNSFSDYIGENYVRGMMGDDYLMNTSGAGLVGLTFGASTAIAVSLVAAAPFSACTYAVAIGNGMVSSAVLWLGTTGLAKAINPTDGKATFGDFVQSVTIGGVAGGGFPRSGQCPRICRLLCCRYQSLNLCGASRFR